MRKQLAINNPSNLQILAEAASNICDKNNPKFFNKNYIYEILKLTYPELIEK